MKFFRFTFILLLIVGCSGRYNSPLFKKVDYFLICQLRFLDNSGNYIDAEDKRLGDIINYGRAEFITKTFISGRPLEKCGILNRSPAILEMAEHIEYSDKWRYVVIEPYSFASGEHSNSRPNQRQVFIIKHPRKPKIDSWSAWGKPDFIGDLPETSFVLLGNNREYLSQIKEPPYFEMRYRVVVGEMSRGVLSITNQK